MADSDEHVIVVRWVTATRDDRRHLDADMVVVYRVVADQLVEARYYVYDLDAYDRFWS